MTIALPGNLNDGMLFFYHLFFFYMGSICYVSHLEVCNTDYYIIIIIKLSTHVGNDTRYREHVGMLPIIRWTHDFCIFWVALDILFFIPQK